MSFRLVGLARLGRGDRSAAVGLVGCGRIGVRWLVPDENLVLTSVAATLLVYRRSLWFMFVKNPEYLLHVASLVLIRRLFVGFMIFCIIFIVRATPTVPLKSPLKPVFLASRHFWGSCLGATFVSSLKFLPLNIFLIYFLLNKTS